MGWDLVSMVISTLIGIIGNYKYSYPKGFGSSRPSSDIAEAPVGTAHDGKEAIWDEPPLASQPTC